MRSLQEIIEANNQKGSYRIVRYYTNGQENVVLKKHVTLEEAKAYCKLSIANRAFYRCGYELERPLDNDKA
jgi:hypothetical protein